MDQGFSGTARISRPGKTGIGNKPAPKYLVDKN
jgi:hypothetical protein